LIGRIPFEAPESSGYEENKHQLIGYGLKLLSLSRDSSVVSESSEQEAIMSVVSVIHCVSLHIWKHELGFSCRIISLL